MARPRKDPSRKQKPREIYASDDEWAAKKADAAAAGMSVSRYLISGRAGTPAPSPGASLRNVDLLTTIQQCLFRIAEGLAAKDDLSALGAGIRLVAVERRIARLIEEAEQ